MSCGRWCVFHNITRIVRPTLPCVAMVHSVGSIFVIPGFASCRVAKCDNAGLMLFRRDSYRIFSRRTHRSVFDRGSRHAVGDYWSRCEINCIPRQVRLRGADRESTESAVCRPRRHESSRRCHGRADQRSLTSDAHIRIKIL